MRHIPIMLTALFSILLHPCFSQNFEGTISFRTRSESIDRTVIMTTKGDKTVLKVVSDSNVTITIIKDYGTESATLLRSRNELKYGLKLPSIPREDIPQEETGNNKSNVNITCTDDVQMIGMYKCTKIKLRDEFCEAEAWITNDVKFSLSQYFPEFLGSGVDTNLVRLRRETDKKGFIMSYHEQLLEVNKQKIFEITLEEKEISEEAFRIPADYIVLDSEGMTQLLTASQLSDAGKKRWEEFQSLFGKK